MKYQIEFIKKMSYDELTEMLDKILCMLDFIDEIMNEQSAKVSGIQDWYLNTMPFDLYDTYKKLLNLTDQIEAVRKYK
ncbi:MAG: hypothetical protein KBS62_03390 [Oscillospiraceae bacterium]|nr:hypothetical protein [Candidatus Ruminococcus equi]